MCRRNVRTEIKIRTTRATHTRNTRGLRPTVDPALQKRGLIGSPGNILAITRCTNIGFLRHTKYHTHTHIHAMFPFNGRQIRSYTQVYVGPYPRLIVAKQISKICVYVCAIYRATFRANLTNSSHASISTLRRTIDICAVLRFAFATVTLHYLRN